MSRRSKRDRAADSAAEAVVAAASMVAPDVSADSAADLDVSSVSNSQDASRLISLRVPLPMLDELRRHARRRAMPYQSLLKHWLAERLQEESERLEQHRSAVTQGRAAGQG